MSKSGSNTITGTAANEHLNGGSGADIINGMGGNDRINAGSGNDIMDGGSGNDIVNGDSGDDLGIYVLSENIGSTDVYDGGSGIDTLQLVLTRAQWQSPAVQADIARFMTFLAQVTNPVNGQASNANFTFSFGLTVSKFEALKVVVDGVFLDPRDEAVTLVNDVMSAGEETASISVNVLANDSVPDLIATLTNTQPAHGTVTLTRTSGAPAVADTASFVYTPNPTYWQYLAAGQTATDTFTYSVTDSDGDTSTATVTVTITGSNDVPTLGAVVSSGAVVEDGAVSAEGTIAFADVDLGDAHTATSAANGSGYLGTFTTNVTDNGAGDGAGSVTWNFAVDNAAIQYLAAGQTLTQIYTVTVDDGNGGTVSQPVTVTITGTNDAPTITAAVSSGAVVEDGSVSATGAIAFADVDLRDGHTVSSSADGSGYLGAFTATVTDDGSNDGAGSVTWNFAVDNAAIQYLAAGQTLTQTYTVSVSDGQGGTVTQPVTVTITGTNDAPTITAADNSGGVREVEPVVGVVAATTPVLPDVEANDSFATAQLINRTDLRVAAGNTNLADPTDPSIRVQGNIATRNDQDVFRIDLQAGETLTLDIDFAGIFGGVGLDSFVFLYDAAGNVMNFNDDSATSLGGGGSTSTMDSFLQFVATLGGTYYIVVKDFDLFGQSSAGTYALNVSVDSQNLQLTDTGAMTFADVDLRDGHTVSVAAEGSGYLGGLTAVVSNASTNDGAGGVQWTFSVANAAVQFLAAGETRTQSYVVTVNDGQGGTASETVTVTITGENDVPTISTAFSSGQVVENAALAASGVIAFDDIDLIDAHSVTSAADGAGYLGTFSTSVSDPATGAGAGEVTWTFNASDAELQFLAAGQSLLQRYIVTIADGNGGTTQQLVNITIVGTNDAPTITAAVSTGAVVEDGVTTAGGAIAFADVDLRDGHTVSSTADGSGYLGTFITTVTDDGSNDGAGSVTWNFELDNAAADYLNSGQTLTQSYTVTVDDLNGGTVSQVVTITIEGLDDNAAPTVNDITLIGTTTGTTTGTVGGLPLVFSGYYDQGRAVYSFIDTNGDGRPDTPDSSSPLSTAYNYSGGLALGDIDGDGDVDVVTTGNNGLRTYTNVSDVTGDGADDFVETQLSGQYSESVTLVDINGDGLIDIVPAPYYGTADLLINGGDANGDGLLNDFTVQNVSTSAYYTRSTGAADLNGDGRADLIFVGYYGSEILVNQGDTNNDDQIEFSQQSFDNGGSYYYRPMISTGDVDNDGDIDIVLSGESGERSVHLNNGINSAGQIDFTIMTLPGINLYTPAGSELIDIDADGDLDIVTGSYYGAVDIAYNQGVNSSTGLVDFVSQSLSSPFVQYNSYGIAVGDVDGDGDLDIVMPSLDGANSYFANEGDTDSDGQLNFVGVQLNGLGSVWDAAFTPGSSSSGGGGGTGVREDGRVVTGLFEGSDIDDNPATLTYSITSVPAEGTVVNNGDGTFSFAPGSGFQDLAAGETRTVTFTYTATDPSGAVSNTGTVTVNVAGANDRVVAGADTAQALENGPAVTGNVLVNDSDVDASDVISVSRLNGSTNNVGVQTVLPSGALVTMGADGNYIYDPNGAFERLAAGEIGTDTFTYEVTDGHGGQVTRTVTVSLTGSNDAPTAQNVTLQANQLGNGGFDASPNFLGWTVSTATSGLSWPGTSTATVDRSGSVIAGDSAVAVLNFDGTVPSPYGTGQGPSITSTAFAGQAGDTVRFVYQLSSGGDQAIGTGYIRDAVTGAIVQTIFNYQTPFSGSTGVVTQDVVLASSGNYTIDFRIGSYDATGGQYVGARLDLGFAGILRAGVGEDESFTFSASNFTATATDPDGDLLSVFSVGTSANGAVVTLNADGSVLYNPAGHLDFLTAGQQIVDTFQYTLSDGRGGFTTATASVTVIGKDEAPAAMVIANSKGKGGEEVLPGSADKEDTGPAVLPGASEEPDTEAGRSTDPFTVPDDDGMLTIDADGVLSFGSLDGDDDFLVLSGDVVDQPLVLPSLADDFRSNLDLTSRPADNDGFLTIDQDGQLNFGTAVVGQDPFVLAGDLVDQPLVLPGEGIDETFDFQPLSDLFAARHDAMHLTVTENGDILSGTLIDTSGLYNWS